MEYRNDYHKNLMESKEKLRIGLLARGFQAVTWTIAFYDDETNVWDGPTAAGDNKQDFYLEEPEGYRFGDFWYDLAFETGENFVTGKWVWSLEADEIKSVASAWVSEPQLQYCYHEKEDA